MYYII